MKKLIYIFLNLSIIVFSNLSLSQVTFTDVAVTLGVNDAGAGQGSVFLDVNNDGFLDIYLVNNNNQNKLWINNGGTGFTESSVIWGIGNTNAGRGVSAGDFNNDGFIDIMIGNWQQNIILFKNSGTNFIDFSTDAGVSFMAYGGTINWFDFNNDGKLDAIFGNNGMPPRYSYLFKNITGNTFLNESFSSGLTDSSSTLTIATADYDNDGDIDVFKGTQSYPNSLYTGIVYKNNGNGTFTEAITTSNILTTFYTWGCEWGDYNNDGYLDLYLASTTGVNQLFKNNGNGTFTELANSVGLYDAGASYSCAWFDYDNDGDIDLYIAKGQTSTDKLYRNDNGSFTDVTTQAGIADTRHSANIISGDFNNDGWVDLYLVNNGTENRLYKNNGGNSNKWLIAKLQGVNTNRSAIGCRVTVVTGSLRQIREVEGGSGGKGHNSLPVEFGLGSASIVDSLIIRWQSGLIQRFANVLPNNIYNIIEGQPLNANLAHTILPEKYILEQNYPNPFNSETVIKFSISKKENVKLSVFDITGKELRVILDDYLNEGIYEKHINFQDLPSGVYIYKLSAGSYTESRKMILHK